MAKFAPTPRSLRDEAMFDLDEQLPLLRDAADHVGHLNRIFAQINRLRHNAVNMMGEAQQMQDEWDGVTERRMTA